jgi:hypothetical protein
MNPRGIPMANRCWPSTRTSTTLIRTPGWHGGREERMCRRRSVEFQKIYIWLCLAQVRQPTGHEPQITTGMGVSCRVFHQQLLHLRRPAMAGSLEYRSLEVGRVVGQRKPTTTPGCHHRAGVGIYPTSRCLQRS